MCITPRMAISLLLIGCTKWGPYTKASRTVDIYFDVQDTVAQGSIPKGAICRIDERLSAGKVYGFHKIECINGQSGYLMLGEDESAFDPRIEYRPTWGADKKAIRPVDLYPDVQETARPDTIQIGIICRIENKLSPGKTSRFNNIECQNGQSGYVEFGDGWKAF
jgi:hypothetical protein